MKIEVGEFVRTSEGYILQNTLRAHRNIIENIEEYDFGKIVKHSKNIIDLIEVGDVLEVHFPIKDKTIKVFVDEYFKDCMILDGIILKRVILKTILTKEQYKQNCYILEEN